MKASVIYCLRGIIAICLLISSTLIGGGNDVLSETAQTIQNDQLQQERERKLRSEIFNRAVRLASAGDSIEQVRASVESVANFIRERAEVVLSNSDKQRFVDAEKNVLDGKLRKLSVDEMVDLATDTLVWRLSVLTDEDLEKAIKVLRGDFNAESVRLRYDGSAMAKVDDIARELRSWRAKSKQNSKSIRNKIRRMVEGGEPGKGIKGYVSLYRQRLLESFGRVSEIGATPLQSLLIFYSVASDDLLDDPTDFLREAMDSMYGGDRRMPDPGGRSPFGSRGYLFPMPLDLVFDERTLTTMLNLMEKKISN